MYPSAFVVPPRIEQDSTLISDLPLSQLRLMDDRRFPWLVLVPRRAGAEEWSDLSPEDALQLSREIHFATRLLIKQAAPHKVNIATLGNVVRQMHIHIVGRETGDGAWPGVVWGCGKPVPYSKEAKEKLCTQLQELLGTIEPIHP